jgi:hypothetical protein
MSMILSVPAIRSFLALLLLGTWFTCTVRCSLEMMASGNSLTCCDNGNLQSNTSHTPTDTDHCVCGWMKSGGYAVSKNAPLLPKPSYGFVPYILSPFHEESPSEPTGPEPNPSPPYLPASWQFSFRTAASPRAPSIAS